MLRTCCIFECVGYTYEGTHVASGKVRLTCSSPIEIPYYSAGFESICFRCGSVEDLVAENSELNYPICSACVVQGKVAERKRKRAVKQ